jgi:hypothetical protein
MPDVFKSMSPEEYMAERLDQYQQWYDKKSIGAKSKYMGMRAASVVGAAIVPVIVNLPVPYASYAATIISLAVVIVVSLESVYHFGDQWRNYRSTEQFLLREKILFRTADGPYRGLDKDSAFLPLVERCEAQISAENSATLNVLVVAAQQPDAAGSTVSRNNK